jgi:hypothetical protein
LELRYRDLRGSIRRVNAHVARTLNDSKRKVRLSRLSMGEGDSHVNDAGNVTPASDVS